MIAINAAQARTMAIKGIAKCTRVAFYAASQILMGKDWLANPLTILAG